MRPSAPMKGLPEFSRGSKISDWPVLTGRAGVGEAGHLAFVLAQKVVLIALQPPISEWPTLLALCVKSKALQLIAPNSNRRFKWINYYQIIDRSLPGSTDCRQGSVGSSKAGNNFKLIFRSLTSRTAHRSCWACPNVTVQIRAVIARAGARNTLPERQFDGQPTGIGLATHFTLFLAQKIVLVAFLAAINERFALHRSGVPKPSLQFVVATKARADRLGAGIAR